MKKGILLLLVWLLLGCFAADAQKYQQPLFGRKIKFEVVANDTMFKVRRPVTYEAGDNAISQVFDYLKYASKGEKIVPKSPILLGVKLNPNVPAFFQEDVQSVSKKYTCYNIPDSSAAILVALGITSQNVKDYKYHVVENDSLELVPWSPIPKMEQKYGAKKQYGFIGEFRVPGKQIMIEVVNIKNYSIRDGVIFDWQVNNKPVVTQLIVRLTITSLNSLFNLNYAKVNHNYATKFDSQTGLPLDMKFPVDSVYSFQLSMKPHITAPYHVYMISNVAGKVDTAEIFEWDLKDYYEIENKFYRKPGKYELYIEFMGSGGSDRHSSDHLRIPFEVLPLSVLQKKASFKQILPYAFATLSGVALLFWGYRRSSKTKLARSDQEKEGINLKLRSIRSQLNPHFMFNALTSIQNLMNKNETEAANHYLAMFANLTRKVLNTSEQELISLEDEIKILEDYLQMEQLRFGFQYQIKVDDSINMANTDIPAMLLQPFVENAVKHGVAELQQNGMIKVLINKNENDLILSVTNNGQGFNKTMVQDNKTSFGLKLSEERIALLNQVHKDQPVTLNIDANPTGTIITIELANLFA